MASRRGLSSFPQEYPRAFIRASQRPLTVACDSAAQARYVRNDLYQYRKALHEEAETDTEMAIAVLAAMLRFRIEDNNLIIEHYLGPEPVSLLQESLNV